MSVTRFLLCIKLPGAGSHSISDGIIDHGLGILSYIRAHPVNLRRVGIHKLA